MQQCRWADGYSVVFDCESDCGFAEVAGYTREEKIAKFMQFTVVCAQVIRSSAVVWGASADDVLRESEKLTWWRDVAQRGDTPVDSLLALFDGADVIVGYNCLCFDFPLLKRFYGKGSAALQRYASHRSKCLDIMARVHDVCGVYYKLDALLTANGLEAKIGHGSKAIQLWHDGRREELQAYCASDVELTARLALLETLGCGNVVATHNVHGLRSAIAASREASAHKRVRAPDNDAEEFVVV